MSLKSQDVLVALKLIALGRKPWTYAWLAVQLAMSPSQVHAAVRRGLESGLLVQRGDSITANSRNLSEFLRHGIRYVFVPERGELTRGMPTAHAAPPLAGHFVAGGDPPPIWPDPNGEVRGASFSPLYPAAPEAARNDQALYELLVLVDAIRGGRARERAIAVEELTKRLDNHE